MGCTHSTSRRAKDGEPKTVAWDAATPAWSAIVWFEPLLEASDDVSLLGCFRTVRAAPGSQDLERLVRRRAEPHERTASDDAGATQSSGIYTLSVEPDLFVSAEMASKVGEAA